MIKIGNRRKAITMTRSDEWFTPLHKNNSTAIADYCLNCTKENCKGDCKELKEFMKAHLRRRKSIRR